jgi:glycosyltransferase involved in cell wall biosynthesis
VSADYKSKNHKILHLITRLIVGGAQENTMYTAALLDKTRFLVDVISGPQTGSEGSLIETTRNLGVNLEILPDLVREINPWKDLSALWQLFIRMKMGHYRIVHTHSSKAGILGRIAAKLAGIPVIIHTVHGWSFHGQMSPARRCIYVLLERFTASFSDAMIVVAQVDIQKGLENRIGKPDQYNLIRSAIPLEVFNPSDQDRTGIRQELGIPLNVPVMGNIGRFSPQKNPLDWIRIAKRVVDAIPDCYFLLVGDGPLRGQVERLIADLKIEDRTVLTGLRRDVPRMLAAMDLFLLTSLWEGLPRVIPQAMAMGIPVVANQVDGNVEVISHGETGYLCRPGDLTEMTRYCEILLKDPLLSRTMGERGRKLVLSEFDLTDMVTQIEDLYQGLLCKKGIQ